MYKTNIDCVSFGSSLYDRPLVLSKPYYAPQLLFGAQDVLLPSLWAYKFTCAAQSSQSLKWYQIWYQRLFHFGDTEQILFSWDRCLGISFKIPTQNCGTSLCVLTCEYPPPRGLRNSVDSKGFKIKVCNDTFVGRYQQISSQIHWELIPKFYRSHQENQIPGALWRWDKEPNSIWWTLRNKGS